MRKLSHTACASVGCNQLVVISNVICACLLLTGTYSILTVGYYWAAMVEWQCWQAPLPFSPLPLAGLLLRGLYQRICTKHCINQHDVPKTLHVKVQHVAYANPSPDDV